MPQAAAVRTGIVNRERLGAALLTAPTSNMRAAIIDEYAVNVADNATYLRVLAGDPVAA
jgi:hypothetical protein